LRKSCYQSYSNSANQSFKRLRGLQDAPIEKKIFSKIRRMIIWHVPSEAYFHKHYLKVFLTFTILSVFWHEYFEVYFQINEIHHFLGELVFVRKWVRACAIIWLIMLNKFNNIINLSVAPLESNAETQPNVSRSCRGNLFQKDIEMACGTPSGLPWIPTRDIVCYCNTDNCNKGLGISGSMIAVIAFGILPFVIV